MLAYVASHRIRFYITPTGASWLNRIECHCTALRKFTLDSIDYRSYDDMQAAIRRYLDRHNGARQIRLENWKLYYRHKKQAA